MSNKKSYERRAVQDSIRVEKHEPRPRDLGKSQTTPVKRHGVEILALLSPEVLKELREKGLTSL
jgi:hypothetical protein